MSKNINGRDIKGKGLEIAIDGTKYFLTFTLNALCELEEKYGHLNIALEKMVSGSVVAVRYLLFVALKQKHDLSLDEIGNLITVENIEEIMNLISESFNLSMPEGEEGEMGKNQTETMK